ncbi:MAG TPA: peptidase [Mogibacterium sp.]|nr:peptidase [Mogibacterium sp.]
MGKIKSLFSTTKKAVITSISIVAVLVIGGFAVSKGIYAYVENSSISKDAARRIALKDANVNEDDARFSKVEFEFENGSFVYDVEFENSKGSEFEYTLKAKDGTILNKVVDIDESDVSVKKDSGDNSNGEAGKISADEAKQIALGDAGISEADATFTKIDLDKDDGILEYEIEFQVGEWEYEYTINASNGKILDFEKDHITN